MKCRKSMIILTLAVFLFSMAGAFAADDAAMAGDDTSQLELSQSDAIETAADDDSGDEDNIIGEEANQNSSPQNVNEDELTAENYEGASSDVGNFTELASLFNGSEVVTLEKDYKAESGEKSIELNGLFNGFNIHVYGNNHTIDANGVTSIFGCDDDAMESLIFENINFVNGDAGNGFGGAINIGNNYIGQPVTAINCTFTNNKAEGRAGALYNVIAMNCTFNDNRAGLDGGAMAGGAAMNCTFNSNHADGSGGAMIGGYATDCNFTGNTAKLSGGATEGVQATNCAFTDNHVKGDIIVAIFGGAMNGGSAVNCVFTGNTVINNGGAMARGTAINCTFEENKADGDGGALFESTAMNCTFKNNEAKAHGQAMYKGVEVLCHYEDGATHGTEHITDILNVTDYNSTYNSGEKLFFELQYNDIVFTGFKVTISVYQNGEFLNNYSALNDEGWTVPLKPGIYNATVNVDNYSVDSKDITITIDKGISNITVNVNDTVSLFVDDTAEIAAKLNNETVQLNYTSSNDTVASVDENGIITAHNVGEANITISFDGNETYAPASKTVSVIVDLVNTTINASDITVNFDETASIGAVLTPQDAGNLTYESDDEAIATVDENGVVRGIKVGAANITITFNGTNKYRNSTRTIKVTVMPTNSSVKAEDIEITYGKTITIHVTSENATGIVYVISDKEGNIVKNGTLAPGENITGFTLDMGEYDVNLTTIVSENHIQANCLSKLIVDLEKSAVKAEDVNVTCGEVVVVKIDSVNANQIYYRVLSDLGVVSSGLIYPDDSIVLYNLPAGNYTVNMTTVVDIDHKSVNNVSRITVNPIAVAKSAVRAEDVSATFGESVVVRIESVNATQIYYRVLGDLGVVSSGLIYPDDSIVLYNLPAGNYTVNMTTVVDIGYESANNVSKITVVPDLTAVDASNVVVTYDDGSYYKINVYGTDGKPADGVDVIISGDISKVVTTANGIAKFKITQVSGTYKIAISALGTSAVKTIKVKKATPKIIATAKTFKTTDKTKKYAIKLKDGNGKAMAYKKVVIKVNGVKYTAKTNYKGIATFNLKKLTKMGIYKAKIGYVGDDCYNTVVNKVKIKIK